MMCACMFCMIILHRSSIDDDERHLFNRHVELNNARQSQSCLHFRLFVSSIISTAISKGAIQQVMCLSIPSTFIRHDDYC